MTTIGSDRLVALLAGLCGMAPVTASDGAAVLEQLSAHKTSLVLTDDGMPSCNGVELMTRIHAPDTTIPVSIVSGKEPKPLVEEAKGRGLFGWIETPFDRHRLKAMVMTALQVEPPDQTGRTNASQLSSVPSRAVA
jgi:two-component system C4-dicarboxylate transport response regulator DctD